MAIKKIDKANRFEKFEVGQVYKHHWGRTITEGDNTLFSTLTMNYNPLYFNKEYAKEMGYEGTVVNPLLVMNTLLGLSVEDLSEGGGPFLSINNCRFHKTFYPGDTLSAESVVVDKRETKSRPEHGIVHWKTVGKNQRGEVVVEYERMNLIKKREERKK